jgi:MFS family permease|tara:strand:+ start:234 stop:1379 length:1146 start_codon:yes stop_codon:yes gene_type:complete
MGMGFTVLFPVLAPLGRELGLQDFQITSIISISSLTVFLSSPHWGRLSDRYGRRRVMLIGVFGFSLGTIIFNTVLNLGLSGWLLGTPLFISLIVARVTHASLMSAGMPAATAYMADITDVSNRTKGMGAAGAANNIGSILGPALAGLAVISLLAPLWTIAVLAFLNGLFILKFLPESPHSSGEHRPARRLRYSDPRILPFVIVGVCMFTGFALVQQTMGFRFQDVLGLGPGETAQTFGLAMMCTGAASLFAQLVVVQKLDIKPFTLLRLAMPLLIVAFTLMTFVETQLLLTLAMTFLGFGMGLAGPGFMAGASLAVSPAEQGAVAGVAGSCGPLGFTIGPFVGGLMYQYNPTIPYAFAAGMYVILFIAMFWLVKRVSVHAD